MLSGPPLGDWFCLPQDVIRVDRHAPEGKEHRWIVAGSGTILPGIQVVLRSTKAGYGGREHGPHEGSCGSETCRIDQHGWIRHDERRIVRPQELTLDRRSCHEPDDDVIEFAMRVVE